MAKHLTTLDNFKPMDEESIGKQLQKYAKEMDSQGEYRRIGEVHGFSILVCSEPLDKEGLGMFQNKFCVEGNYKYKYNNGLPTLLLQLATSSTHWSAYRRP